MQEFIAYRRISAAERGRRDLVLEEQAASILRFVSARGGVLLQDFVDVEAGKGSRAPERRPRLGDAMRAAKDRGAVLVVARLDRLSLDAGFLSGLIASGVSFLAADTPDADTSMLQAYAAVAQREREHAATRISTALQAKKRAALAQGLANPLGNVASLQPGNVRHRETAQAFAERLAPALRAWRAAGMSQREIVDKLNGEGIRTAGGGTWSLVQLQRVLARLPAQDAA